MPFASAFTVIRTCSIPFLLGILTGFCLSCGLRIGLAIFVHDSKNLLFRACCLRAGGGWAG